MVETTLANSIMKTQLLGSLVKILTDDNGHYDLAASLFRVGVVCEPGCRCDYKLVAQR